MDNIPHQPKRPWAVEFRSSVGFCTAVVFFSVFVDLLVYSVIIPVIPFRLEELGYQDPSALTGWLLVVYSLGLLIATPPLAFLAEKYWSRRTPLIFATLLLIGSQVLFIESKTFWLMCFARAIQGVASAIVWVVAFALLCDTVPEQRIGQQLGVVMMGLTVGFLVGPPMGGVLYDKLGYRAPFILAMIACALDLIGRLAIIEKHDAARWVLRESNGEDDNTASEGRQRSQLSVIRVIIKLARSRRAFTAFLTVFFYGITFTIMEPTLPLRLQDVYGYTSLKVGIIYLAAVVPSIFSTPVAGWMADKMGTEWVTVGCLMASTPWWIVMAIRSHIPLFVASLAMADFFLAAVVTPVSADLAAAARETDGIGYAHVFGAFNFAYSVGSVVGPLVGGQIYAHVKNGWTVLMGLSAGLMLFATMIAVYGAGDNPLWTRFVTRSIRLHEAEEGANRQIDMVEKSPGDV